MGNLRSVFHPRTEENSGGGFAVHERRPSVCFVSSKGAKKPAECQRTSHHLLLAGHAMSQGQQPRLHAKRDLTAQHVKEATTEAATRFADFDRNGDMKLDWEEFLAIQIKVIREQYSLDEIRSWYDLADVNGDGEISISEWFVWTLDNLADRFGVHSVERIFSKYDTDGSGVLDIAEFEWLAATNGFGAGASAIFRELDADDSGTVSYKEIVEQLRGRRSSLSSRSQQMLSQVMWAAHADGDAVDEPRIDTSDWRITARDVDGVCTQIKHLVEASGAPVADVLRLLDVDVGTERAVDDLEFFNGLQKHFAFKGSFLVAAEIFRRIDTDGELLAPRTRNACTPTALHVPHAHNMHMHMHVHTRQTCTRM